MSQSLESEDVMARTTQTIMTSTLEWTRVSTMEWLTILRDLNIVRYEDIHQHDTIFLMSES